MCSGYPNNLGDQTVAKCGSWLDDYGEDPRELDEPEQIELILFDAINFNNIGLSMLTIFQTMLLSGWTPHMYNFMDATSAVGSAIFFILVVVLGNFIAMNLVLAQIMFSFVEED